MFNNNNGNDGILMATAFGNMMENNSLSGAMLGVALSNAMNDQVFRQVLGFKLLKDEEKGNDGVGIALLMNSSSPTIKPMIQPPTLGTIYGRR